MLWDTVLDGKHRIKIHVRVFMWEGKRGETRKMGKTD